MYPDLDGYFLDCIGLAAPCKQKECIDTMLKNGLDPDNQSQLLEFDHELKIEAARRVRDAVPAGKYFFCNGIKELQDEKYINEKFNTHYEVESVPGCGSWGYDCLSLIHIFLQISPKTAL